jgi:hypothetical protein
MSSLFAWSGEYVGFVRNGRMFSREGNYFGWIDEDRRVWSSSGAYMGNYVDGGYVLRNRLKIAPVNRVPKVAPIPPFAPFAPFNKFARFERPGHDDALRHLI